MRHARAILVLLSALALAPAPAAASEEVSWFGRVLSVRGPATLETPGAKPLQLSRGARLYVDDLVRTGAGAAVRLLLADQSVVDVGANTQLAMLGLAQGERKPKVSLRLILGRLWARVMSVVGGEDHFIVETDNAVAGVRGTELVVLVDSAGTRVQVVDGVVSVRSRATDAVEEVGAGKKATVGSSGNVELAAVPPSEVAAVRADTLPRPHVDAAEWATLTQLYGGGEEDVPPYGRDRADGPMPPLETEPGVGVGSVHGTITVEDR